MARPKKKKTVEIQIPEDAVFIYPEDIDPKNSLNNPKTCMVVTRFVDGKCCHGCPCEDKCVYERKYKYFKPR